MTCTWSTCEDELLSSSRTHARTGHPALLVTTLVTGVALAIVVAAVPIAAHETGGSESALELARMPLLTVSPQLMLAKGQALELFGPELSPRASTSAEFSLEEATISDITAAFKAGALTCQRLAEMYLNRIAAYDGDLHLMITINPGVMETAAALDQERQAGSTRGPLHCVPLVLKDNFNTFDMPTSNGSVIMKDAVPPDDAFVTRRLREAGALILGKSAMGEFAGAGYNTIVGYPVNPYHRLRGTSASSSGSAAAVAANFAVLSVGTDTLTSVRGPAAANGIVGLRPSTGLISRDGIAPRNLTFDTAGPMARTVTDMAILLNAIAGPDPNDPDNLSIWLFNQYPDRVGLDYTQFLQRGALGGARIGVARDYFGGDPQADELTEAAIDKLRELGAEVIDPVYLDPEVVDAFQLRDLSDYRFRPDFETYLQTFGPEVPKTVQDFVDIYQREVAHSPLPVGSNVMALLQQSLLTAPEGSAYIDLIENVLPRQTALKLATFDADRLDALVFPYETFAPPISSPVYRASDPTYIRSTRPSPATIAGYSSLGFPGIVLPMGFDSNGLPGAISFLGRPMDDAKLIGYAYDYEQATMHRRPSPLVPPLPDETIIY